LQSHDVFIRARSHVIVDACCFPIHRAQVFHENAFLIGRQPQADPTACTTER
jgi:hypothetical protein